LILSKRELLDHLVISDKFMVEPDSLPGEVQTRVKPENDQQQLHQQNIQSMVFPDMALLMEKYSVGNTLFLKGRF
jgi:hypothetical protein